PNTTDATARGFPACGRLLLLVWTANGCRGCGASDDAGDGDQGHKIRERGEELTVAGPGVHVLELRRQGAREAEEQRGPEDPERAPVAEDQCGQGDEAAAGCYLLAEGVDVADRDEGAAAGRERARRHDRPVADGIDVDPDRVGGTGVLAAGADPQAE